MTPVQILFVDDEPSIRLTLPAILSGRGYHVTTASTVPEALAHIGSHPFEVLISDLNISHPGDGFAVVSAMRRTQPDCINFILTGYPAFEAALQAIRSHVDHYLIKPSRIDELLAAIEAKLADPGSRGPLPLKQVSEILKENVHVITARALEDMKTDSEARTVGISDLERIDHIPELLSFIAEQLDSDTPDIVTPVVAQVAARHGYLRRQQKYSVPMVVEDIRFIDQAIYETIQDHLISLDLSNLVPDLRRVNRILELQLKESLRAYLAAGKN